MWYHWSAVGNRAWLSGCDRDSLQSIKFAFCLSFLEDWSLLHGAQVCGTKNSQECIHSKSFSQEETDVLVWEVQNCCEWICDTLNLISLENIKMFYSWISLLRRCLMIFEIFGRSKTRSNGFLMMLSTLHMWLEKTGRIIVPGCLPAMARNDVPFRRSWTVCASSVGSRYRPHAASSDTDPTPVHLFLISL